MSTFPSRDPLSPIYMPIWDTDPLQVVNQATFNDDHEQRWRPQELFSKNELLKNKIFIARLALETPPFPEDYAADYRVMVSEAASLAKRPLIPVLSADLVVVEMLPITPEGEILAPLGPRPMDKSGLFRPRQRFFTRLFNPNKGYLLSDPDDIYREFDELIAGKTNPLPA